MRTLDLVRGTGTNTAGNSRVPPMRTLIVALLVAAGALVAVAVYWFVVVHPRRGALFVALAVVCLVGAWVSNRAARQRA